MSESNPLFRLAAALCAIVAIALAAATVQSPLETDSGSGGSGGGVGNGDGGGGQPPPPDQPGGGVEIPAFLEYLVALVLVIAALALVWYLIAHRREAVKQLAVGLAVLLVAVALIYAFADVVSIAPGEMNQTENVTAPGQGGDEPGGSDGDSETSFSPVLALAVLGVVTAIFVAGVLLTRDSSDGGSDPDAPRADADDPTERDETTAAVGSAAGTAADRLEGADDFDNAIYRAWREMTDPLEVDRPESSTPREFAQAATDAGLDRDDVDELTRLFEDVRYGDATTTPEREARAVDVLRRIEAEYADGTVEAGESAGSNAGGVDR